ncbi:putative epoxide hydrolase [Talaromyces proteolyticus]|uniref:Epoxide hydrolase n=1 Tax=Talaromyces proteolyticus TaxID=1131652 RepID=A0AAD4Q5N7_9EURO|nr:putative epoxide hydrolase [Talaromyces proteolyticus]KAH8704743.1 putative epoxide hydrolase [Talaromyces proteolyticus]
MFDGFTSFDITVEPDVTIHGVSGGSGPAILLLHGFPQTHHIWHKVADELAKTYFVVAIDLRGYGQSSKPGGGEGHIRYGKKAMARDAVRVMDELLHGKTQFYICAHDRGARVAHRLCVDYPERVHKAIFLDICPTLAMYSQTDMVFAKAYFHWFFLIQEAPFPETLILANPTTWLEGSMGARHAGLGPFTAACLAEYKKNLTDTQTVHAMCEDYRAAASIDLEEAKQDIAEGRHVQCPLTVFWGAHGVIEKCFDAVAEWKKVSTSTVEGKALDCGHYIPEERPEDVLASVLEFLVE